MYLFLGDFKTLIPVLKPTNNISVYKLNNEPWLYSNGTLFMNDVASSVRYSR